MKLSSRFIQIVRFALVGGVNTATFYGFYLVLHSLMAYFAAYSVAFALSMTGSFFLNTYFTYRSRPTWRKFLLFPLTNVTNYVITSTGVYGFVEWAGMNNTIAPLVAATAAIPFTYLLSRHILTRDHDRDHAEDRPAPLLPAGSGSHTAPVRGESG